MDKIAIILRKSRAPNIFRKAILRSFNSPEVQHMLLSSGFFQEGKSRKRSFFASRHFRRMAPQFPCAKSVTAVGVYNGLWRPQFNAFATALSGIKCLCGSGPTVHKMLKPLKNKWHAKVFIGKTNGRPSIGIIGSSNITRPAFGQNRQWNSEVDVIMWGNPPAFSGQQKWS